jgi:hypothetical protein
MVIPRSTSRARNRCEEFISRYYPPNIMMFPNSRSEYSFYELDDDGNNYADNDHRGDRKIKLKVLFFDPDITR